MIDSCIRPNKDKIAGFFDTETVAIQLKYTGVLETTRIRRLGYSTRMHFKEFVKRYAMLVYPWRSASSSPSQPPSLPTSPTTVTFTSSTSGAGAATAAGVSALPPPTRETCADILNKLELSDWRLGKTKVFLKHYHVERLSHLHFDMMRKIVLVQCLIRRWLARHSYERRRERVARAATLIQAVYRGYRERKRRDDEIRAAAMAEVREATEEARRVAAARHIQRVWRGQRVRKRLRDTLHADKSTKDMQLGFFCQQVTKCTTIKNNLVAQLRNKTFI